VFQAYFYQTQQPAFFRWRLSKHSFLSNAAPSIAFYLTQLQHSFLSNAAPSIAFYLTLLEAYFYLTQLPAGFLAGAAPCIAFI